MTNINSSIYWITLFFLIVFASCNNLKKTAKDKPIVITNDIAPDQMLIQAKIVEIAAIDNNAKFPCNEAYCKAVIKIINTKKSGHSFKPRLNINDELEVKFTFSLNGTKELFPNRDIHLEKLTKGDKFEAKITQHIDIGNKINYTISDYYKLN